MFFKLSVALKKEFRILAGDRVGLALMFVMPLLLVVIITIIQDSTFRLVNENKISILVVNQDSGVQGKKLVDLMNESGLFDISRDSSIEASEVKNALIDQDQLTALHIPYNFSKKLTEKATLVSSTIMSELGVSEDSISEEVIEIPPLSFYHDPVLQENYCSSIMNMVYSLLGALENELMIEQICLQMDLGSSSEKLRGRISGNRVQINQIAATSSDTAIIPNSTQHNVPAWTVFAMFFMVVSLGNSIVKERLNGSFVRLKTMPTSFFLILASKVLVYLAAAILQVIIIFSVGIFLFPSIGLPELVLPTNWLAFAVVVLMNGLAAVSYALMLGTLARTQEQANGFGAVSIVIFAALGGIWVPTFVMPQYLQYISNLSPLRWCLEGFYVLFLKGGAWSELPLIIMYLFLFVVSCTLVSYLRLKSEKIL